MPPLRAVDLPPKSGWFGFGHTRKCEEFQKAILAERSETETAQAWAMAGVEEAEWRRLNTILNDKTWSRLQGWFLPDDELFQIIIESDDLYLFICEIEEQFQCALIDNDDRSGPWPQTLTVGEFYEIIRKSPPGPPKRGFSKGCLLFLTILILPSLCAAIWSLCTGANLSAVCEFTALTFVCTILCVFLLGILLCIFPEN
ncbi:MAG: hypothetical protein IJF17_08710 [Thermoguttaceae bacterium]|nr:hypothetical protein [Thermoguttaceae bacterium]